MSGSAKKSRKGARSARGGSGINLELMREGLKLLAKMDLRPKYPDRMVWIPLCNPRDVAGVPKLGKPRSQGAVEVQFVRVPVCGVGADVAALYGVWEELAEVKG